MRKASIVLLAFAAYSPVALSVVPPVAVISREDLEQLPDVGGSLADLVNRVPAVPGSGAPAGASITLRGAPAAGNNQPLILVDGVRYTGGETGTPLGGLDPDNIESVQVIKGAAAAALYGNAARNGVINVRTRKQPKIADARGSYVLGDVQHELGDYRFSLQSDAACDATNGAANPAWSYFNKFNYGLPEFSNDGKKAYFGSADEGYRFDYGLGSGFDYSAPYVGDRLRELPDGLDAYGYPDIDELKLLDPFDSMTFRHLGEIIEKLRNDPRVTKQHVDGLMLAIGFAYAFGGSLYPYSDQAVEAGVFDPAALLQEIESYVAGQAGTGLPAESPAPAPPAPAPVPSVPPVATPAAGPADPPPPSPFERYPYPPDYAFDFSLCTPEQRARIETLIRERDKARADMSYYGDYLRREGQSTQDVESDLREVANARQTRDRKNDELRDAWRACVTPEATTAMANDPPAAGGGPTAIKPGTDTDWDLELHVYRTTKKPDGSPGTEPVPDLGIGVLGDRDRFDLGARLRYRLLDDAPADPSPPGGLPSNRVFTNDDGVARIPRGFRAGFGRPGDPGAAGGGSLDSAAPALGDLLLGAPRFSDRTPAGRDWNIGIDYGDLNERPTLGLKLRFDKVDSVIQGYPGLGGPGMTFDRLPDATTDAVPDAFRQRLGRGFSVGNNFYQTYNYAEYLDLDPGVLDAVPGQGGWNNNDCGDSAFPPDGAGYLAAEESPVKTLDDRWALARVNLPDTGSPVYEFADPVIVGIIDTGIDWHHPDLPWDALWKNEDEIPDNGIDDDGNGYIDDVIGWDFAGNSDSPYDHDGHGTFVAGLIAAEHGNDIGIDGINPNARIMVLKALNNFGRTRASMVAEAIIYGADNGARILNLSVAGPGFPSVVQDAVDYATAKGVLVVLAAGNRGEDVRQAQPALLRNVLLVGATDANDNRAVFSNVGDPVTVVAPGVDVVSLRAANTDFLYASGDTKYVPGDAIMGDDGRYYRGTGTSFAAPVVSGVASLLQSQQPRLTAEQVTRILQQSAYDVGAPGKDIHTGYGIVDASAALRSSPDYYVDAAILGMQRIDENGDTFIAVGGSATASQFGGARLEIGQGGDPQDWVSVAELPLAVERGELGRIPAAAFEGAATWTVRLVVSHRDGGGREARYQLTVE